MGWFYNGAIRRNLVAFGQQFTNLYVRRYNETVEPPTLVKEIKVPISLDAKSKMVAWLYQHRNETWQTILPRLSFSLTGIQYAADRKINPLNKVWNVGGQVRQWIFYPVPFDLTLDLSVWTKYHTDGMQLIEQIASKFNPVRVVTVKEFPELGIERDVEVILEGVQPDFTLAETVEADQQLIRWNFNFAMRSYLYPSLTEDGEAGRVIETIIAEVGHFNPSGGTKVDEIVTITEDGAVISDPPPQS
jgi:hypothetical protein